jgi:hypothetical protein
MFYILIAAAVVLAIASYGLKIMQLALLGAVMWATLGGYCFSQSTATWDIFYVLGFVGFIAAIGEGYQAWGFMTKKEETEDDKELSFEDKLERNNSDREKEREARTARSLNKLEVKTTKIKAKAESKYFGQ